MEFQNENTSLNENTSVGKKLPLQRKEVFISVLIVLGIVIIALVGYGVYKFSLFYKEKLKTDAVEKKVDISSWQTYQDTNFGYSFKYPTDWKVDDSVDSGKINAFSYQFIKGFILSGKDFSLNIAVRHVDASEDYDFFLKSQHFGSLSKDENIMINGEPALRISGDSFSSGVGMAPFTGGEYLGSFSETILRKKDMLFTFHYGWNRDNYPYENITTANNIINSFIVNLTENSDAKTINSVKSNTIVSKDGKFSAFIEEVTKVDVITYNFHIYNQDSKEDKIFKTISCELYENNDVCGRLKRPTNQESYIIGDFSLDNQYILLISKNAFSLSNMEIIRLKDYKSMATFSAGGYVWLGNDTLIFSDGFNGNINKINAVSGIRGVVKAADSTHNYLLIKDDSLKNSILVEVQAFENPNDKIEMFSHSVPVNSYRVIMDEKGNIIKKVSDNF